MLSMQQTVLKQITELEQPQEDVQLTELLPVKQSRIRENVLRDADATDALRALRSFSSDCNDGSENFDLQHFNFCKNIAKQPKFQSEQRQAQNVRRKRTIESRNNVEEIGSDDDVATRKSAKKTRSAKKNVRAKELKRSTRLSKRKENEKESDDSTEEKSLEIVDDDDEFTSDCDEEELYLDPDKRDYFKDEVYVYRQESMDPCSSSEFEDSGSINHEVQQTLCNKDSTTDGNLFKKTNNRKNRKNRKNGFTSSVKDVKNVDDALGTEKELRLKVDTIIRANYRLRHENNNIVDTDGLEVSEDTNTSSATTSAKAKNSDSDSSCNTVETKKKKMKNDQAKDEDFQKKYYCVVCNACFRAISSLRNHYKSLHSNDPWFRCNECGKDFALKERLKLHMRMHTGFKPYKCPECDKCYARSGQLVQHRRTHSQTKPFSCSLCSSTFTCSANLSLHLKRHSGQKDHKCELCSRAFVRRDALKKHLECLHRDVKSFICKICNKAFKGHLPQHMRTHVQDRPHGCGTCGQRFAQKSQLTVHLRTHSGQRPFRCLVCWQAFAHSTALKLHTRRHTGERPFKCTECSVSFTQLPHWKKHMKCIHGRNEPYDCKRCKTFFRIKSDLDIHERLHHPELETEEEEESVPSRNTRNYIEFVEKESVTARYKQMTVGKMRLLLAVLLKKISKQEKLDELGFGKRLIDDVLQDSLVSAGKEPATGDSLSELETLTRNLEIFLEWTVPKEHWEKFRKMKKSPQQILEALTAP